MRLFASSVVLFLFLPGFAQAQPLYALHGSPLESKLLLGAREPVLVSGWPSHSVEIVSDAPEVIRVDPPEGFEQWAVQCVGVGEARLEARANESLVASATVRVVEPDATTVSLFGFDGQELPSLQMVEGSEVDVWVHVHHEGTEIAGESEEFSLIVGDLPSPNRMEVALVFRVGFGLSPGLYATTLNTGYGVYSTIPVRVHPRDAVQHTFAYRGGGRSRDIQILLHTSDGVQVFGATTLDLETGGLFHDTYAYRYRRNEESTVWFRIGREAVTATIRGEVYGLREGGCATTPSASPSPAMRAALATLVLLTRRRTMRRISRDPEA